jgi:hypothetical protein
MNNTKHTQLVTRMRHVLPGTPAAAYALAKKNFGQPVQGRAPLYV